jgi:hypothetical protein
VKKFSKQWAPAKRHQCQMCKQNLKAAKMISTEPGKPGLCEACLIKAVASVTKGKDALR